MIDHAARRLPPGFDEGYPGKMGNERRFMIEGAVLGALKGDPAEMVRKFDLEITERVDDDPSWIAIVRTRHALTEGELELFHSLHDRRPPEAPCPWFFIVTDVVNGNVFVMYSDEEKRYPLMTPADRDLAVKAGLAKGLNPEHLAF